MSLTARERQWERESLAVPVIVGYGSVLYCADPALRTSLSTLIDHDNGRLQHFSDVPSLRQLVDCDCVSVVTLALSRDPRDSRSVDAAEFQSLIAFLHELRDVHRSSQCLLISPVKLSLQDSCQAVLAGVSTILNPQDGDFQMRLQHKFREAFQHAAQSRANQKRMEQDSLTERHGLVGVSSSLKEVIMQARKAATVSDAPVIIYGESGTGKQRLAEVIHSWDGKRCKHPFVSVNCAAITGSLAESELFGHNKGAFTGATDDRPGYFRSAHGGTILLDEISELDLSLQPKILRVLQEGLVLPVGSDRESRIDVRVIAATNQDLKVMVGQGRFRLDLFQRLNVIYLNVPPLRQRIEDIPMLFEAFLEKYAHYSRCDITGVEPGVYDILAQTVGSGNVRELENIVRQVLVFKDNAGRIEVGDLPRALIQDRLERAATGATIDISDELIESMLMGETQLNQALEECEQMVLSRLLKRGLNRSLLAKRLGVTRRTLYNKLQKYKLA